MTAVVLYGRPGCHLCEDAEALLQELGIPFERRDIEADDELFKRMLERIPVLEVDGEERLELVFGAQEVRAVTGTLRST
ncbi:glutaredoxin family protein [Conexibacter sp. SYSU D00693]|uniref:glutaredoxin family protein n=1 Tax=Conexibacter sp. SYSU D00693 TaxID=2812560 RepID=UPI001F120875|nr:glutaredoxin family protein [Conexibacter sp. SYSU D00693]